MRIISLPAMVLGIVLAIAFFELYGYVTRPSVPKPIAVIVDELAPGVEIGVHVSDARHSVAAMSYVPHVGFVGLPATRRSYLPNGEAVSFSQVRLLLDERTRSRPQADPGKSRVDAVEIVTAQPSAAGQLGTEFAMLFRRPPRDGCIRGSTDDDRRREVHVWTTPNDRGGLAIVTDYSPTPAPHTDKPVLTSVFAFSGKFDGSRTLRASYIDAGCADSSAQAPSTPSEIVLAAAAADSLTAALSDSLAPSLGFVVGQSGAAIASLSACDDPVDSRGWETGVSPILEIPLPPGFTGSGESGQTVRWTGPGGWITASADRHGVATGVITSDCDVFVSGAPTHVQLGSTSYGRSVHALIKPSDAPPIEVSGWSKTIEGQAQVLHAIRYAHISMSWGRLQ